MFINYGILKFSNQIINVILLKIVMFGKRRRLKILFRLGNRSQKSQTSSNVCYELFHHRFCQELMMYWPLRVLQLERLSWRFYVISLISCFITCYDRFQQFWFVVVLTSFSNSWANEVFVQNSTILVDVQNITSTIWSL